MNAKKAKLIKKTVFSEIYDEDLPKKEKKKIMGSKQFKSINRGRKRHYLKTGETVL